MLCCICYRLPATIFAGKAGYCSGCHDPRKFIDRAEAEDAKDKEETEKLEKFREKQARKNQRRNNRGP